MSARRVRRPELERRANFMQPSSESDTNSLTATPDARFAGRTIVVTGAGAGIGRATVLALLAEGATVIAADVAKDRLQSLSQQAGTDRLRTVAGDLTDDGAVDRVVATAGDRIDAVASVAGIFDGWLPPAEIDDKTWDNVLRLNVTVPMRLTRAVLPSMISAGQGALVYTSSLAGMRSSISGAAYTTSKHALNGFVKSVAYYYGPIGVRANAVAPGGVQTAMDIAFQSELAQERAATAIATATPIVEPEVVTRAMLWLLSDDAAYVNGAIMPTDNGWSTF
jgi:NAD(P)-dependent dehydrogenase (short-subunit alcohol dehydrogenase family)